MPFNLTKPLRFAACDSYGNVLQIHDGLRQVAIVEVCTETEDGPDSDDAKAETAALAYARLFVAAPDMLRALKGARQYVVDGTLREAGDDYAGRLLLDALDAAIEKAGAP